VGLLARIEDKLARREERNSIDWYIENYLIPAQTQFGFAGHTYQVGGVQQTGMGPAVREVANALPAYMQALRACPPAFAAQMIRAAILSSVRFTFRNGPEASQPRKQFGLPSLSVLERPWPNATTGQLVTQMEWHEGLTGNAYVYAQANPKRLRLLRPDWVGILYGSQREPDDPLHAIDGEVLGYVYQQGGFLANRGRLETFLPNEIAHWSPLPDPESPGIGMAWLTPAIRDMQGDRAATEHKLRFFSNGATPNMVVKGITAKSKEEFDTIVDMIDEKHQGLANAYRTLYLTAGADATVVGANLRQMDFATVQGKGETRIAMLSRIPAAILQISEGLQGSALNAGNFGPARRTLVETFVYPWLQDLARALAPLVDVPIDAELWFDSTDMPILREDAKDAAEITKTDAGTIGGLVQVGFKPKSVIAAVTARNMTLLEHDERFISVQLQALASAQAKQNGTAPDTGGAAPGNDGAPAVLPAAAQPAKLPPAKEPPKLPAKSRDWRDTLGIPEDQRRP
jgi:phage portal protein BeeE